MALVRKREKLDAERAREKATSRRALMRENVLTLQALRLTATRIDSMRTTAELPTRRSIARRQTVDGSQWKRSAFESEDTLLHEPQTPTRSMDATLTPRRAWGSFCTLGAAGVSQNSTALPLACQNQCGASLESSSQTSTNDVFAQDLQNCSETESEEERFCIGAALGVSDRAATCPLLSLPTLPEAKHLHLPGTPTKSMTTASGLAGNPPSCATPRASVATRDGAVAASAPVSLRRRSASERAARSVHQRLAVEPGPRHSAATQPLSSPGLSPTEWPEDARPPSRSVSPAPEDPQAPETLCGSTRSSKASRVPTLETLYGGSQRSAPACRSRRPAPRGLFGRSPRSPLWHVTGFWSARDFLPR